MICVGIGYAHKEWYIGAKGDEESPRGSEAGDGGCVHYEEHKVHSDERSGRLRKGKELS